MHLLAQQHPRFDVQLQIPLPFKLLPDQHALDEVLRTWDLDRLDEHAFILRTFAWIQLSPPVHGDRSEFLPAPQALADVGFHCLLADIHEVRRDNALLLPAQLLGYRAIVQLFDHLLRAFRPLARQLLVRGHRHTQILQGVVLL